MTHEKIFKLADGSSIKIIAHFNVYQSDEKPFWSTTILRRAPGKRKWVTDYNNSVNVYSIHATKLELWEKLKPTL